MKKGYTDIILVLDKSGSMGSVLTDTIGGYNQFIKEQREEPGEAKFTLALFDTTYNLPHNGEDIKTIPDLNERTFSPSGMTALYDAIGRTIVEAGDRFNKMKDEDKPEKVIFVILTDGAENASREISKEKAFEMITHQKEKYEWEFVFLGANQNAFDTAHGLGIKKGSTMTYAATSAGVQASMGSMSRKMSDYRGISGQSASFDFDEDDYKKQEDQGVAQDKD